MRALVVVDSFKCCLPSVKVEAAVREALVEGGLDQSDIYNIPVSDGGEGFSRVVTSSMGGEYSTMHVHDAEYYDKSVKYGVVDGGRTAIIESASIIGYGCVRKDPLRLTSFGVGEAIRIAAMRGARRVFLGLGGVSTCDGGVGALQALGVRFWCGEKLLAPGEPALLRSITKVDSKSLIRLPEIVCVCDTNVPFCGPQGAVRVFAGQKGLDESRFDAADAWMRSLSVLYTTGLGMDLQTVEGSGAAGGISGAFAAVCDSEIVSGASFVLELSGFNDMVDDFDVVITGEGQYDAQTATGKLPSEVLRIAKDRAKVVCIAGCVCGEPHDGYDAVIQATPAGLFNPDGSPKQVAKAPAVAKSNIKAAVRKYLYFSKEK